MSEYSLKALQQERKQIDPAGMWDAIAGFADQLEEAASIPLPENIPYSSGAINHIVFCGMGGSAIGGDLLNAYYRNELIVPLIVNRNYTLPNFVSSDSLVVVSSYSGNTEETLSAYMAAQEAGAMIVGITSNGELSELLEDNDLPWIKIPGGMQPRAALGYSFIPMARLLKHLDLAGTNVQSDIQETISVVRNLSANYQNEGEKNLAFELAKIVVGKVPVFYTDPELAAVGVRWKGQLAENAEMLAFTNELPEMNHNEVVGWNHQPDLYKQTEIFWLRDSQAHEQVARRAEITRKLLEGYPLGQNVIYTSGESWMARLFSLIHLGDWVSLYAALLQKTDPTPVDRITLLKNRLASAGTTKN